jgi:type IX secretion system PorP/SprF family membrane protein
MDTFFIRTRFLSTEPTAQKRYKNMRFAFTLILSWSLFTQVVTAQDAHYSQYFAAPYQLNPALTGVFNGKVRVTTQYREQWKSFLAQEAFKTYSVGADMRIPAGRKDYFAIGLKTMRDEAGAGNYSQSTAHMTGSFVKQLSGGGRTSAAHYMVAGGDLGFGQNSVNWSNLWFSRQYDAANERPDVSMSSNENFANTTSRAYFDGSAGLLWYALYDSEGFIYAGGSMHHINEPKISLMEDSKETLYRRWSAHAGGLVPITETFGLAPAAWVTKQGPAFMANFGSNVRYTNHDLNELTLRAGAFARVVNRITQKTHVDAIAFVGMVEINRWQVGLSYDVNVSSLTNASNSRGAFEITAQYIHPEGRRRSKVTCPKL